MLVDQPYAVKTVSRYYSLTTSVESGREYHIIPKPSRIRGYETSILARLRFYVTFVKQGTSGLANNQSVIELNPSVQSTLISTYLPYKFNIIQLVWVIGYRQRHEITDSQSSIKAWSTNLIQGISNLDMKIILWRYWGLFSIFLFDMTAFRVMFYTNMMLLLVLAWFISQLYHFFLSVFQVLWTHWLLDYVVVVWLLKLVDNSLLS